MGWYLNSVANNIAQIEATRTTAGGLRAAGLLGYSYAIPNSTSTSQANTWSQLVAGPFPSQVEVPPMPWKTDATRGHLMGTVQDRPTGDPYDDLTLTLAGPVSRTLKTDGTGFFGAVDLPPGEYTLSFSAPGQQPFTRTVMVTGAQVAQPDLSLVRLPFEITSYNRGEKTISLTWNSVPGRTYRVEQSQHLATWSEAKAHIAAAPDASTTSYIWTIPSGWEAKGFLRVVEE